GGAALDPVEDRDRRLTVAVVATHRRCKREPLTRETRLGPALDRKRVLLPVDELTRQIEVVQETVDGMHLDQAHAREMLTPGVSVEPDVEVRQRLIEVELWRVQR